jgi:hypothetical protein
MEVPRPLQRCLLPPLITHRLLLLPTRGRRLSFVNHGWFVCAKLLELSTSLRLRHFWFYLGSSALPNILKLHLDAQLLKMVKVTPTLLSAPIPRILFLRISILSSTTSLFSVTHCICPTALSILHARVSLASRRSKINGGDGLRKSFLLSSLLTLPTSGNRIHCDLPPTFVARPETSPIASVFVAHDHWQSPVYSLIVSSVCCEPRLFTYIRLK